MKKVEKTNTLIMLVGIVFFINSYINDIKKTIKKISIKAFFIGEAIAIIMIMFSIFSIIGEKESIISNVIGILAVVYTVIVIIILIKKPKSDWHHDWFFGTD